MTKTAWGHVKTVNHGFIEKSQKNTKKRQNFENLTWQKVAKKGLFSE
jgi:hypothetical protein